MESTKKKSNKWAKHITSIASAVTVVFVAFMLVMFSIFFIDYSQLSDTAKIIITSVITLSLLAIPCYFICRENYKSVWYVPILVNCGTMLIVEVMLANYWSSTAKNGLILAAIIIVISLSILGHLRGKQINNEGL